MPVIERMGTPPPVSRWWLTWTAVLATVALLIGVLPSALAAPGDSAADAIPIGAEGRFSGTVGPEKSVWYRFWYRGNNETATVTVTYSPEDSRRMEFLLYTGSAQDPRPESGTATRNGNTLVMEFRDPSPREVYVRVINEHNDRTVSFVGTISPSDALATPTGTVSPTPTPGPVADTPQTAVTVGADGALSGTIAPRKAVWYRFYYGNPGIEATLSVAFAPSADGADLNVYTGSDLSNLTIQSGSATRSGNTLSRKVNLSSTQWVYFTVVNNNDATTVAYAGTVSPASQPPTTPTPTETATPVPAATATPIPAATPQPAPPLLKDNRYFFPTGYRIDNDEIWAYFQARGQIDTFGYPVSRTFTFLGCQVQIFQRQLAQACPGRGVALMNLLDPDLFPYTRVNGSTFPGPDEFLKSNTPPVSDPEYATKILDFVRLNAPNTFEGEPVNFGQTFFSSITPQQAGTDNPGILGLFDLEVWGAPISRPMRDPSNGNFIYQRFQRGIMHYTVGQGTRGILLADYLKAILRDRDLPGDLREQARTSRYFAQYCPGAPGWLCRPNELPGTDLTFAFEQG